MGNLEYANIVHSWLNMYITALLVGGRGWTEVSAEVVLLTVALGMGLNHTVELRWDSN